MEIVHKAELAGIVLAAASLLTATAAIADTPAADNSAAEKWNVYGQATYIWHRKNAFSAAYTNLDGSPNSLLPEEERGYTTTATLFFGYRPWKDGEVYLSPELISELPLSQLRGLGGSIQDGELEKNGLREPTIYRARLFLRQTWRLGGAIAPLESAPMQLAGTAESRRLVLTAGNLSVLDMFDKNAYASDVRSQFLNMDFLTHAAYDFAADARGYTWGAAGEYYDDDWVLRFGRFLQPREPNQLQLNYSIMNFHGDQVEIEHRHMLFGAAGKLRFLAYRNVANMGRFDDAINAFLADPGKNATTCTGFNYGSANAMAPDLCWARRKNAKTGVGINLEQEITQNTGVFLRALKADGRTEVYAYTSADSSLSLGGVVKGAPWGRARDALGIGAAQNSISAIHKTYLGMGGIDGFIGDGRISYRPERALETYYSVNLEKHAWITLDFQHVSNPAFNSDRGPVTLYGGRLHLEF